MKGVLEIKSKFLRVVIIGTLVGLSVLCFWKGFSFAGEVPASALSEKAMHCNDPLCLGNIQEQKVGLELLKQDREECLLREKLNKKLFNRGIINYKNFIRQSVEINNYLRVVDQLIKEYQSDNPDPAWLEDRMLRSGDFAVLD